MPSRTQPLADPGVGRDTSGEHCARRSQGRRALGLLLCVLGAALPAGAEIVERILAVVDGRPVLLTEAALVEAVRGVDRRTAVEALIDERLMFREAARLPQTAGDDEEAYRALEAKLPAELVRQQAEELRRMVQRQGRILRYIELRFRPLVRVDDEQVRSLYRELAAADAGTGSFETVEAMLRARLERRELDEKIEAWVRELRAAAEIRYNPEP